MNAILVLMSVMLAAAAQPAPKLKAIRAARLLDVRTGNYVDRPVVIIDGARIKSIDTKVPDGAEVIDLGSATLLPGLIDVHTHLLQDYDFGVGFDDPNMVLTVAAMGTAKRVLLGAKNAREALEAGITTVRDLGNSGRNGDVALRDAIANGWVMGPRMIVSTRALSAIGGQFGSVAAESQKLIDEEYAVVTGVEEARRAVRQALYDGADCIKIIVGTGSRILSLDEMKTIVEEAHRVGRKVAAHAIGDMETRIAAKAGVDSIEHAYVVPDDVLKIMAEKKIFLVPTDPDVDFPEELIRLKVHTTKEEWDRRRVAEQADNKDRLQRALKAGVRIAAGSDMYYQSRKGRGDASITELESLVRSGLTPLDAIRAATINAAELLGMERSIGVIEVSRFADLIAVPGDPLQEIAQVRKVTFVMKAGSVIKK